MRSFSLAALAACTFACSHPAPPPAPPAPPPPPAPTLADEVDALCACTTPACRTDVRAKFANVDRATDSAPHTLALRAYLKQCGAEDEEMEGMHKMDAAMCACRDAACVDRVQKDYADFMKMMEDRYKNDRRPSEALMDVGEHMAKCMSDAMAGGTTAPSGAGIGGGAAASASTGPAWDGTSSGVPACDEYLKAFDRYMACDKIPQQAKDASRAGIDQMKQGFAMLTDPNVPPEAKKAAADACAQAIDALRESAKAMGCKKI